MLCLKRKEQEGVTIYFGKSEEVHTKLHDVHGSEAKLGFEARCDIEIWRDELKDIVHFSQPLKRILIINDDLNSNFIYGSYFLNKGI